MNKKNKKPQHIIKHMFDRGYASFTSKPYTRNVRGAKVIIATPPRKANLLEQKEWERGYNTAYFNQLKKVKMNESRRRSKEVHAVK
tara:strand:+ start:2307 stop:2564 length:258 start_codon:yes stop_codon:yes gene_type:complete